MEEVACRTLFCRFRLWLLAVHHFADIFQCDFASRRRNVVDKTDLGLHELCFPSGERGKSTSSPLTEGNLASHELSMGPAATCGGKRPSNEDGPSSTEVGALYEWRFPSGEDGKSTSSPLNEGNLASHVLSTGPAATCGSKRPSDADGPSSITQLTVGTRTASDGDGDSNDGDGDSNRDSSSYCSYWTFPSNTDYTLPTIGDDSVYTVASEDVHGWTHRIEWWDINCSSECRKRPCDLRKSFCDDDREWGYEYCQFEPSGCQYISDLHTRECGHELCKQECVQLHCHRCCNDLVRRCTACCGIVPMRAPAGAWRVANDAFGSADPALRSRADHNAMANWRDRKKAGLRRLQKRRASRRRYVLIKPNGRQESQELLKAAQSAEMRALDADHAARQAPTFSDITALSAQLALLGTARRKPASVGGTGGTPTSHDEAQRLAALRNVQRAEINRRNHQRTRDMPAKLKTQQSKLARLLAAHRADADALQARHAALQMPLTAKIAAAEAERMQLFPDGAVTEAELCSEDELCSEEESDFDEEKELKSATLQVEQCMADRAIIEPEQPQKDAATLIPLFLAAFKEAREARLAAKSAYQASPSVASSISSGLSDAQDDLGRAHGGPDDRSSDSGWCEHCCASDCICHGDEDPPDGPHPTAAACPSQPWPLQGRERLDRPEVHVHRLFPADAHTHAASMNTAAVACTRLSRMRKLSRGGSSTQVRRRCLIYDSP